MSIKPNGPKEIPLSIKDKLDFLKTVKVGERFYDVYEIKKSHEKKEINNNE